MEKQISKQQFVNTINDIQKVFDCFDNLDSALEENGFYESSLFCPHSVCRLIDDTLDLLDCGFDLEEGEALNWIEYFVYELEFGKCWDEDSVSDSDGTNIPMGSAEQLYNFLIREQSNRKN